MNVEDREPTAAQPTQRDELEAVLMREFGGVLRPLQAEVAKIIAPFKRGDFATSVLGLMLYCNGYNLRGRSTRHPNGLCYFDGEHLFGVGLFKKTQQSAKSHLMVVAPAGPRPVECVEAFLCAVQAKLRAAGRAELLGEAFVRHLPPPLQQRFLAAGYHSIEASPWHLEAPSEDEQENHKLIALDDILRLDPATGQLRIKTLGTQGSKDFRSKSRLAYNRFHNFLDRNALTLEIVDYDAASHQLGEQLVTRHFASLHGVVGSTPEDYFNLLRYRPLPDDGDYYGKLGWLASREGSTRPMERQPVMLFIGEKTAPDTLALYATFALREPAILPPEIDAGGFTAISQYAYLRLFQSLYEDGVRWVNVGGSETRDLDRFKRQLGARHEPTHWVVRFFDPM